MRRSAMLLAASFLTGCAVVNTARYDPSTGAKIETSHTFVFAQKSVLKGYKVFNHTGTNGSAIAISGLSNETQAEVITASAEGLGTLIGAAAKTAATK